MAKRKPGPKPPSKKKNEKTGPSLRDLLLQVQPQLIHFLMELSGAKSQAEFADKAGVLASDVSRYVTKQHLAADNLPRMAAKSCGLDGHQVMWVIGHALTSATESFAVELPGQADEVREPESRYRARSVSRQVEDIKSRDLAGLDANDVLELNRSRHAVSELHGLCEKEMESLDQLFALLYRLIAEFEEKVSAARDRARLQDS